MAHRPVGSGSSIAVTLNTSVKSGAFSVLSNTLRVVTLTSGAHVAIGNDPTATAADYFIPPNTSATLALTPASQRVIGITTGSTTLIDFPEGTGCPFSVGDYVSLTCEQQNYYNFTHQQITAINTVAGPGGYYSRRVTVATNTAGISTTFSSEADLRKSLKIASYGSGSGALYFQQVQISGDA